MEENRILSVSQINEYIRYQLEKDAFLLSVAVRGEISYYKCYPSGHHYFTLKDDNSALRCVLFKGNSYHLRFRPENGMKIIAFGKISVYAKDGSYQLNCTALNVDGIGDLHMAFEQLKKKLREHGLFDTAHKKPLPQYPETIGIVTSSAGAAVHDMIRILRKRYPLSKVRLLPVRVQGEEAPGEIAEAIDYANQYRLADLLIVGRGGGSIEDLWAFNEEAVAYAIYRSEIPVISAVGHEPDVTISDLVADVRAATPSNAAELAVPDRDAIEQTLDGILEKMTAIIQGNLQFCRVKLQSLASSASLCSPQAYIDSRANTLQLHRNRMSSTYEAILDRKKHLFFTQTAKLDAMSPLKVLTRGYSVVKNQSGSLITRISQIDIDQSISIRVSDGTVCATVTDKKEYIYEQ